MMDQPTAANRTAPLATHSLDHGDGGLLAQDAEVESSQSNTVPPYSGSNIAAGTTAAAKSDANAAAPMEKQSLQDRLLSRLLQQVLPADYEGIGANGELPSAAQLSRAVFSVPIMTNSFRKFISRIGIVFLFQDQVVDLLSWQHPCHTVSLLATYSFICLNPYLLVVLPLAITLLFIMVPAFLIRHPPPPPQASASSTTPYYSTYQGPAFAPAVTMKPAPETSVDFFRNIRYLQNTMADFCFVYDLLNSTVTPATNFSDEIVSSTIFVALFVLTLFLFITAHLIPWRFIALFGGNAAIIALHPLCLDWLLKMASKSQATLDNPIEHVPQSLQPLVGSLSSITLSATPETREVEIFELQYRPLLPFTTSSEWIPYLFTPTPYDPLSPARISGERAKGTRFFEDVQPPEGWEFHSKRWKLDRDAGEWVNERLIVGVEYELLNKTEDADVYDVTGSNNNNSSNSKITRTTSGGRNSGGWVWDLPPAPSQAGQDEELFLAYSDSGVPGHNEKQAVKQDTAKKGGEKDWEESVRYGNDVRTGEWRRRRWVRLVRRKWVSSGSSGSESPDAAGKSTS